MSGAEQAWALFHIKTFCQSSGNSPHCSRSMENWGLLAEHIVPHGRALCGPGEVSVAPSGRLELVSETEMTENSS